MVGKVKDFTNRSPIVRPNLLGGAVRAYPAPAVANTVDARAVPPGSPKKRHRPACEQWRLKRGGRVKVA